MAEYFNGTDTTWISGEDFFAAGCDTDLKTSVLIKPIQSWNHVNTWYQDSAALDTSWQDTCVVSFKEDSTFTHFYTVETRNWTIVRYERVNKYNYRDYYACYLYTEISGVFVLQSVNVNCSQEMSQGGYVFSNIVIEEALPVTNNQQKQTGFTTTQVSITKEGFQFLTPVLGEKTVSIYDISGARIHYFAIPSETKKYLWSGRIHGISIAAGPYIANVRLNNKSYSIPFIRISE